TGFDSLVENQSFLTFDGQNVGTVFDGYVFKDKDLEKEIPKKGETRLVTESGVVCEFNGSNWQAIYSIKMHCYPFGTKAWVPMFVDIDLGSLHQVTGVFGLNVKRPFGINTGYNNQVILAGTGPHDLEEVGRFKSVGALDANEDQVNFNSPKKCSYIRIAYDGKSPSTNINVVPKIVAVIGKPIEGNAEQQREKPIIKRRSFDEYLGINSVREDDLSLIKSHYTVCKYHRIFAMDTKLFVGEEIVLKNAGEVLTVDLSIPHDEYPNDKIGFNPARGAGGFDFDTFLRQMIDEGMKPIPILSRGIPYLHVNPKTNKTNGWQIPYDDGGDSENPMHYRAMASFYYQFAARYGQNKDIPKKHLKLHESNEPKVGLNLVHAVSINNESDKDWFSHEELNTPKEMAAMLSAAIDGHMGLMGENYGFRQADPSMRLMMNGLVEPRADYIKLMLKELLHMRRDAPKYGFPINPLNENFIIDVHYYPVAGGSQDSAKGGAPVESTSFLHDVNRLTDEIYLLCPEADISITECGYDSVVAPISGIGTPLTPGERKDKNDINNESQAKHIIRLAMYGYLGGYDQMFLFTLKDPQFIQKSGYRIKFSTSGLFSKTGPNTKKLSWFAVNTFRNRLAGFTYNGHTIDNDTMLHIVKLFKKETDQDAYVIWLGSNDDSKMTGFKLPVGEKSKAQSIDYVDGMPHGVSTPLS
ncbi:hypothetical protein, partial [Fulvivirga aurantia]|uniref:hypothetical protein n=1 Tax=Fulvivirga aurantia TaxID=2529383 RepID=UPI0016299660